MHSFFDWFRHHARPEEPWLILGKGPSFVLRGSLDLSRYRTLSLNHAVREQPVLAAHVIDIDVVEACGDAIEQNAEVLVMPWYPHVRNEVGERTLAEIARDIPVLGRLEAEGRLLWYDLSTSPVRHGTAPVVEATYFSAEAALNLLALAGVGCVRSLGIDGGSAYSGAFQDLRDSTLLANGRTSFDLQFEGFARTILRTGVDFAPLDRPAPVRIYSAYTPDEALPLAVLHHSIRRRASMTTELVGLPEGASGPAAEGQALVLTPRAQVLADVRWLWTLGVGDFEVLVPREKRGVEGPGLALVGAGLSASIPALASAARAGAPLQAVAGLARESIRAALPAEWNRGCTGKPWVEAPMLYYPADGSEPWLSRSHPLGHLWVRDLLDSVAHELLSVELVAEEVRRRHVRPSLLYQVEQGVEEPLLLPRRARLLDRDFRYRGAGRGKSSGFHRQWWATCRAVGRRLGHWSRELRQGGDDRRTPTRRSPRTSDSELVAPQ